MATYSFLDVNAAIEGPGGAFSLGAGAGVSDEGITIDPSIDINTMTIGADGEVMHSLHADKSGNFEVSLLKTSPVNALLQAMFNFQTSSAKYHGKNNVTLANPATGDIISLRDVAFARLPTLKYAKDGNMNVWRFHAGKVDRVLGALT